jgi:ABC-type sugar transport system substrate-binding protein
MADTYTIGFSNLDESLPSIVYRRQTLERAAAEHPQLRLMIRDNDMDDEKALAHVEEFATTPVDLAIIFHINERLGPQLRAPLLKKRIPIIAVDVPIPMTTFFGMNNRTVGSAVGEALARWVAAHWDGHVDKVLIMTDSRLTGVVRDRIDYSLKGFTNQIPVNNTDIFYIDGGSNRVDSAQRSLAVLERWKDYQRIAVIGVNDDSALGVLDSARQIGHEEHFAVVGHGGDDAVRREINNPKSAYVASSDIGMDQYGPRLIDLSLQILSGKRVPPENFVQSGCVSKE